MKTQKVILILMVTVLSTGLVSAVAMAGSKQHHRWEGVAIGLGAAMLGHAIYHAVDPGPRPHGVYVRPESEDRPHVRHPHRRGHWAWQEIWVPPTTQRVWNPGHYNRRGNWVNGDWIEIVTRKGHWSRQRVWIADNQCRR